MLSASAWFEGRPRLSVGAALHTLAPFSFHAACHRSEEQPAAISVTSDQNAHLNQQPGCPREPDGHSSEATEGKPQNHIWPSLATRQLTKHPMAVSRHSVSDVMTHTAVAIGREASYKEIVELMQQWKVSAVPVLEGEGRVVGVVSEADLLPKEKFR